MSVGISLPRIDARAKVTGQAPYPGDLSLPGMAHAKVLFARRPHARVKAIDTRAARALPGVIEIFTGADVPNNEYGLTLFDAPVMVGTSGNKPFDGVVRHVGEKLAFIVAETEAIAERARALITVEYEDLPVVDGISSALAAGAPQLHPNYAGNVMHRYRVRHGDIEAGFAQADVIVEGDYASGAQEHAYLQPEAGLAYLDEQGRVTVQVAGQWTHEDQEQIAHALRLPLDQVRVIYPAIGGAFGGREDMSVQIVLALATQRLRRPVKIIWTREESIIGHHKRHPMRAHARLGAKRDGTLVAAHIDLKFDAGPYNYTSNKVLGNATVTCVGPYLVPHVQVDSSAIVTNNPPSGAFRGFGSPQALFIAETQMNKLAEALKLDPLELRRKNAWYDGAMTAQGSPVPAGCSIVQVMQTCVDGAPPLIRTTDKPHLRRGRGFAAAHKNIGFSFGYPENAEARIELRGGRVIESATLAYAGADCGQGNHTAILQIAATALGLPPERIELVVSDTATSGSSGSASASRLTFMSAGAVVGAAREALKRWHEEERPARARFVYNPRKTTAMDPETGACDPNITYGNVAQSIDVEVDTETGHLRVLNLTCADDVGKAVNPQQVVGQIEGGAIQGVGWATIENFVTRGARVLSNRFSTYLLPTSFDVPETVESILVETPDPNGTLGIRGMAEMPLLPAGPALVAAVHDAIGVWIDTLPLTPERVREAIRKAGLA